MGFWSVAVIRYAVVAALAFGSAWYVQALRWDAEVKTMKSDADRAISVNVDAVNKHLIESRERSEQIRSAFIEYKESAKNEIDDLERRVTTGPDRLYIKAKCPVSVSAAGTDAGRADAGAAELSAASAADYLSYERLYSQQFGLLQFCRAELKKRSSPSK